MFFFLYLPETVKAPFRKNGNFYTVKTVQTSTHSGKASPLKTTPKKVSVRTPISNSTFLISNS